MTNETTIDTTDVVDELVENTEGTVEETLDQIVEDMVEQSEVEDTEETTEQPESAETSEDTTEDTTEETEAVELTSVFIVDPRQFSISEADVYFSGRSAYEPVGEDQVIRYTSKRWNATKDEAVARVQELGAARVAALHKEIERVKGLVAEASQA